MPDDSKPKVLPQKRRGKGKRTLAVEVAIASASNGYEQNGQIDGVARAQSHNRPGDINTIMNDDQKPTKDRTVAINKPSRHFKLTAWRLLYGVPVEKSLDRQHEIDACRHARLDLAKWDEQKARFPREWGKVLAKRQRRLAWSRQHGKVPDGWTPPDPKDPRRSANKPIAAYLARRGFSMNEFKARYALVPMKRKKGGHAPPWRAIYRLAAWLNT